MPQAQRSQTELAFIPEVTYGVTPSPSPQTTAIDHVSFNGNLNSATLTSNTVRADRQTAYARRGNSSTEGELVVELVPDNFDWLLEAVLQGTWAANVLKIGSTQRSFAIEQSFIDIDQHQVFNGVVFNTMSMEITTEDLVTASFGFMGKSTTAFSATRIDEVITTNPSKPVFFHEGGTFNEGGVAVASMSSIAFEINNNITGNYGLGVTGYRNVTTGKVNVTGTVTGMFETTAMYNKFKNDTDTSLSFTLVAGAETLKFEFHRVKFTSGSINASGDAGVTVELQFTAIYDSTALNTLTITRV